MSCNDPYFNIFKWIIGIIKDNELIHIKSHKKTEKESKWNKNLADHFCNSRDGVCYPNPNKNLNI